MKKMLRATISLLVVLILASVSYGASVGTISGTVKDPSGKAFKGAFIRAQDVKTKITIDVLSDKQGHYQITNLAPREYQIQVAAVGYKSEPRPGVTLSEGQSLSLDFSLQPGMVRWSDLSAYQGAKLLPDGKGKPIAFGLCFACHNFETRWASVKRDEEGWKSAVHYMLTSRKYFFQGSIDEATESDIATYLNSVFGVDSQLPKSPTEMPDYSKVKRAEFSDEAMKIVFVEYPLPGASRMPWSAYPDKRGNIWIPYYNGDVKSVGRLNPETGAVDEWRDPTPNSTEIGYGAIHSAAPGPDGNVWLAEHGLNSLNKLDPRTGTITEYRDPAGPNGPGKHTCRVDGQRGYVWCTGHPVTRFDPKTEKFTAYPEATDGYGIDIDSEGNAWFNNPASGWIGRAHLNGKVDKWMVPQADPQLRRLARDPQGNVWFGEYHGGKIGRLDPETGKITEFPLPGPGLYPYLLGKGGNPMDRTLPGPSQTPYALGIDGKGYIWYFSNFLDEMGRLDPKTGKVVEFPVPHSDFTAREFILDGDKMWFASPANNVVGYFMMPDEK